MASQNEKSSLVGSIMKNGLKNEKTGPKLFRHKKKKISIFEEIKKLKEEYTKINPETIANFTDLPLSSKTVRGLTENEYLTLTEIQRESIPLSLRGEDILGAAETGSGKTLAFIIPILEILYCRQWTHLDGVGALIITPTRELAYQIYETLLKVGKYHDFSAGLIIGGKDLHFEKKRMDQCNIIICTPGRILHHMDINPLFDCSNMQVLVLDEADRCLDLGFEQTMNSIIENLPQERQTLLFSATQTKSVKDLARLSLKHPRYVSVHENKKYSTPDNLEQSYIVCEQHNKINLLWSFIKNHKKQKILIFLSSCKQVKYIFQLFCRLRPGTPLLALYGSLHQLRRMKIYKEFCSKQNVVMFATDIAARGLDFPEVNWVLQLDCPEDANTYIHRAGRTARYKKGGESLLVLLPSEEKAMMEDLEAKKIPITNIKVNPKKLISPVRKIEALLARDPNLKADAQRAFLSYLKSVFLMKNKKVFDVKAIDVEKFAASLGLVVTPRVRFLQRNKRKQVLLDANKPLNVQYSQLEGETKNSDSESTINEGSEHENANDMNDSGDEMDFLKVKRKNHELENEIPLPLEEEVGLLSERKSKKKAIVTKAALAKKLLKKKIVANTKIVFDDEGEEILTRGKTLVSKKAREYETQYEGGGIDLEKAKEVLQEEDKFDKELFREKVKAKHKNLKRKLKQENERNYEVDESDEESEYSEPDLSWLPDPDKVYQNEDDITDKSDHSSVSDDSSDVQSVESIKRELKEVSHKGGNKKQKLTEYDTGLSLAEDEELALRLLQTHR